MAGFFYRNFLLTGQCNCFVCDIHIDLNNFGFSLLHLYQLLIKNATSCHDVALCFCEGYGLAQIVIHRIWIAGKNEAAFFAYRVAIPLQRFKCKNVFTTKYRF